MSRSQTKDQPAPLDPISEWRAWQALSIIYTVLLNRQIQRRWLLEQQCMADCPITQRFRPLLFLEPIPTLHRPVPGPITTPSSKCISPKCNPNQAYNPYNAATLAILREKVHLLRARVEKGKELASEIERRMVSPRIRFPTHFCYTCVGDEGVEVLLTKCGHRVFCGEVSAWAVEVLFGGGFSYCF
ncbi:uncharacterized protein N7511_003293 [Penicillium nucicola]|uniref:uncharacterized protein n=1 Tax=Penicillium nucicola TaxID=1850975 RepID=UPI00254525A1|nr:uncharacterized protein N7511_003293 [Penicillium nucicola]KAJ5771242.1 hypothetical protein N7511_003293 [Penicillium nucicola]